MMSAIPADEAALPTLLCSRPISAVESLENPLKATRRVPPAALDLGTEEQDNDFRVHNTFIESTLSFDGPSLEDFRREQGFSTCPSSRVGKMQFGQESNSMPISPIGPPPGILDVAGVPGHDLEHPRAGLPLTPPPCGIMTPYQWDTPCDTPTGERSWRGMGPLCNLASQHLPISLSTYPDCALGGSAFTDPWATLNPPVRPSGGASDASKTVLSLVDALTPALQALQPDAPPFVRALNKIPDDFDFGAGRTTTATTMGADSSEVMQMAGALSAPPPCPAPMGSPLTFGLGGLAPPSPPDMPAPGSLELPSVGSKDHAGGSCKPCAFFWNKGCENGVVCSFCHLCEAGERKRRQKEKVEMKRKARKEKRLAEEAANDEADDDDA